MTAFVSSFSASRSFRPPLQLPRSWLMMSTLILFPSLTLEKARLRSAGPVPMPSSRLPCSWPITGCVPHSSAVCFLDFPAVIKNGSMVCPVPAEFQQGAVTGCQTAEPLNQNGPFAILCFNKKKRKHTFNDYSCFLTRTKESSVSHMKPPWHVYSVRAELKRCAPAPWRPVPLFAPWSEMKL